MPDDLAEPVVTAACFFSAGGPWVRPSPGIPCALLIYGGWFVSQTSDPMRRENVGVRSLRRPGQASDSERRSGTHDHRPINLKRLGPQSYPTTQACGYGPLLSQG